MSGLIERQAWRLMRGLQHCWIVSFQGIHIGALQSMLAIAKSGRLLPRLLLEQSRIAFCPETLNSGQSQTGWLVTRSKQWSDVLEGSGKLQ
ncbi:MAG TPA: hypothetical protein P5528_12795 [Steroidobacteraceae bacterium]|nr:hypothetical protein [Steroidobacteraceae bacterium]HRX90313.1 hypothetical protein [Steroidobacteraceae bacterium]